MKKSWILDLPAVFSVARLPGIAISAIVALWIGFAAPVAAGYDEGAAAFIRGDYEEAWREWRDLGERGHQSAQYNLGVLYSIGLGVDQDDAEASKWFRRAADRGLPAAQMRLGNAYLEGKGVTEDLREAYFWFTLAATHFSLGEQHEQAVAARESTGAGLTRTQITEVLERAMSWKPLPQSVDESEKERLIAEPNSESDLPMEEGSSSNGLGSDSASLAQKQSDIAEIESEASGTMEPQDLEEAQAAEVSPLEAQAADLTETPSESSEAVAAEADTLETSATETSATETSATETSATETSATETSAAETSAAETSAAETSAAEAGAAETGAEVIAETQSAAAQNGAPAAQEAAAVESDPAEEAAMAESSTELAAATGGAEAQATGDTSGGPARVSYAAHLSSVRSKDGAETEWRNLQGQFPALLDARELAVTPIEVADQGTFYRVMAGLFDDFDEAEALCSQLHESEQYCVVRRLGGDTSQ